MFLIKKAWSIVTAVIVSLCVLLAIALTGVRLVGLQVYTVLSGSMEPTYHTGSVIYVKPVDPSEIQPGDPITFVMNDDGLVGTHRVISVDTEKGHFYTKGDANDDADGAPVLYENLLGKPVFSIPYLGYVANFIQNPPGTYVTVAIGCLLLLLVFLPELIFADDGKKKEEEEPAADPAAPEE